MDAVSPEHQAEPRGSTFACTLPPDVHIEATDSAAVNRVGLHFGSSLHLVATPADWSGLYQRIGDELRRTGAGIPNRSSGVTPSRQALRAVIGAALADSAYPSDASGSVFDADAAALADAVLRLLGGEGQ